MSIISLTVKITVFKTNTIILIFTIAWFLVRCSMINYSLSLFSSCYRPGRGVVELAEKVQAAATVSIQRSRLKVREEKL